MGSVLNLMAFVVFATTLFMRSVDPVVPQIAHGLGVEPATAALLSTAFTLPYALIQPVLGALADMLSKTRLMAVCMALLGLSSIASAFAPNFDTLMGLRVIGGIAAGGVFPIALAIVADQVPVQGRQVAIGRILLAAMSGNLLGASGAGVVGDLIGWQGVFAATGAIDLIALAMAIPGFRGMNETTGRFDLSTFIPNYRAVFSNPLAKYCFGAVFVEAVFLFGVFPYLAVMLRSEGVTSASIAGVVIAGFGIGGVVYTFMVRWLLTHIGEKRLMAWGGMVMAACLVVTALRLPWPSEFANFMVLGFGFYMLHGCIQVYVTELAPKARASATAGHSSFFFLGQALGPVVYGLGISRGIGIAPVLLTVGRAHCHRLGLCLAPRPRLAAPAIGRDALVGQPDALGQAAGLPEHVDRHAAARIPVAADAQVFRLEQRIEPLADPHRAVLVKGALVAEAGEIELERLRLDQPAARHVVDHQMGEIRLAGDRAKAGEFRRGEAGDIIRVAMRIGHAVELSLCGEAGGRAGVRAASVFWPWLPNARRDGA